MKIKELDGKRRSSPSRERKNDQIVISVQVPREMYNELMRIASEEQVSKSVLMRHTIQTLIDQYNQ